MMALYVIVAGVAGLLLLVGGVVVYRRQAGDARGEAINDELLDKENAM